ncbi:MAG: sugar phosphate isomerase/epimerase [Planctomycetia bacterium]|nr:sugar phosphate isomerase/epimerase [Planctomycetia bacterium]
MFICATTNCFGELSLDQSLEKIADLEYSHVELMFHESNAYLKPSEVCQDLQGTAVRLKNLYRLIPGCFSVEITTEDTDEYVQQFIAICKLAKVMQVVTIALRSAPWGFPFNSEVERLRVCVDEAGKRGILVGLLTERGHLTEELETTKTLCKVIPGLHVTLDPSHFIFQQPESRRSYESILDKVCHVRLRDTRFDKFQVCVGQGELEFGKIIASLEQAHYQRGLSVDIQNENEMDVTQEMRKMRLLLESLL